MILVVLSGTDRVPAGDYEIVDVGFQLMTVQKNDAMFLIMVRGKKLFDGATALKHAIKMDVDEERIVQELRSCKKPILHAVRPILDVIDGSDNGVGAVVGAAVGAVVGAAVGAAVEAMWCRREDDGGSTRL